MQESAAPGSCCKTLRYLALATAIVVALLVVITSVQLSHTARGRSRYASARATPGPPQQDRARVQPVRSVSGDAPWALSALPECFRQLMHARGSPAFARAKIPRGARNVQSGETIAIADCTLEVLGGEIHVSRGEERLRIPPPARLLVAAKRIVLDRHDGKLEDVRLYAIAGSIQRMSRRLKATVP